MVGNGNAHMEESGRSAETYEKPQSASEEASTKKLACNPCRERKVRCDREQPACGRCARRGHGCTYSGSSKQAITKLDLSRLVLNLQERLSQLTVVLVVPPHEFLIG